MIRLDTKGRWAQPIGVAIFFLALGGFVWAGLTFGRPVSILAGRAMAPWEISAFLVAAIVLGGLLIRQLRPRMAIELLLGFLLLCGVWMYAWQVFGEGGLIIAGAATLIQAWVRRVWVHDLFLLVGSAGAILFVAFFFPLFTWEILLVGLAMYDTVLGHSRQAVQRIVQSVVHRGIVPCVVIGSRWGQWYRPLLEAMQHADVKIFGVVELLLPGVCVAYAVTSSVVAACVVILAVALAAAWSTWHGHRSIVPMAVAAVLSCLVFVQWFPL